MISRTKARHLPVSAESKEIDNKRTRKAERRKQNQNGTGDEKGETREQSIGLAEKHDYITLFASCDANES